MTAWAYSAVGRTEDVVTTEVLSRLYGQHVDVIRVHGRVLVVAAPEGTYPEHDGAAADASVVG